MFEQQNAGVDVMVLCEYSTPPCLFCEYSRVLYFSVYLHVSTSRHLKLISRVYIKTVSESFHRVKSHSWYDLRVIYVIFD